MSAEVSVLSPGQNPSMKHNTLGKISIEYAENQRNMHLSPWNFKFCLPVFTGFSKSTSTQNSNDPLVQWPWCLFLPVYLMDLPFILYYVFCPETCFRCKKKGSSDVTATGHIPKNWIAFGDVVWQCHHGWVRNINESSNYKQTQEVEV